jgi:mitochondrial fission protein ELM1
MPALTVLILSDGRPGHFNLSEGIAAAIGRLGPTEIERIEVRRGRWPGLLAATLANARLPAALMLRTVYCLDAARIPPADIVVSAGAETLAASIWIARHRRVPNIFYGSLRRFRPADFSLVLTSYERNAGRPRHALALKPSRLDPDRLPPSARSGPIGPAAPPATAALLIGGNAGGISYTEQDWARLLAFLRASNAIHGTRWLVSNSRRTPHETSNRIADLAAGPDSPIARFIDVRTGSAETLESMLAAVEAVVCTDDSSSMVSEAIWARRPVVGVRPAAFDLPADEARYRSWLAGQRWISSLDIADLTPESFIAGLADIAPLTTNPLDDLAGLLASRIPGLARNRASVG